MKVLLAVDGSEYSAAATREVAARQWPPDTVVRVLSAVEPLPPLGSDIRYDAGTYQEAQNEAKSRAEEIVRRSAEELRAAGLMVETRVRQADPRVIIVDEAKEWPADLIVMGSHGYTGLKKLLLGSVAQSVVNQATCSVQVVRPKQAG